MFGADYTLSNDHISLTLPRIGIFYINLRFPIIDMIHNLGLVLKIPTPALSFITEYYKVIKSSSILMGKPNTPALKTSHEKEASPRLWDFPGSHRISL